MSVEKIKVELDSIVEELIMLCEISGELDPDSNARIEHAISQLNQRRKKLEASLQMVEA